jgi:IS5 family transposase
MGGATPLLLKPTHYPTDSNLLLGGMRKVLLLSADLCAKFELSDLLQYRYNFRKLKYAQRQIQKSKRGKAQDGKVEAVYSTYINLAELELAKITPILEILERREDLNMIDKLLLDEINRYVEHATRQVKQIERRVINGETIPHPGNLCKLKQKIWPE